MIKLFFQIRGIRVIRGHLFNKKPAPGNKLLPHINRIHRTNRATSIAFDTQLRVDGMYFVWGERNGVNRALLHTHGTTDAFIVYRIGN